MCLRSFVLLALVQSFGWPSTVSANIGDSYGFGSRAISQAGAGSVLANGAYAAYSNPAGLSRTGDKRLVLNWGLVYVVPSFSSITGVVIENGYVSDKPSPITGNIDTSYRATFGQTLGFAYQLAESHDLTVGATFFLPLSQAAYVDTGETFQPEYFLYRARTQRPQFEMGVGAKLNPHIRVGLGFHLSFSMTSTANITLQSASNTSSSMRHTTSVKPRGAPVAGIMFSTSDIDTGPLDSDFRGMGTIDGGLVFRFPVTSAHTINARTNARLFGTSTAGIDLNFPAMSAVYYDPMALELGAALQYLPNARVSVQLDYQLWHLFKAPMISINDPNQTCTGVACGITIEPVHNPAYAFGNIVIPRIGHELELPGFVLRAGYAFRASIMRGVPTEAGNYLDPAKHIISAGAGVPFKSFLAFDVPCTIDASFTWQQLVSQHVVKSPGDEIGNLASSKVGAPGYTTGGHLFGGGLSVTLAF